MEMVLLLQEKGQHDQDADHRGKTRGQDRAEDPHMQREDEYVIQDDINKTAADHGGHGELGRAVIPHETQQHIVEQEHGRKKQEDLQISPAHPKDRIVRAQHPCDRAGAAQAQAEKDDGEGEGETERVCKYLIHSIRTALAV